MTTELWLECLDKYLYHREEETCKLYYVRHYGLFATITRSKVAVEDWRVSLYFKHLSQSPAPLVIAKLRDGSPILVRLDDYVGRSIYYFGDLDRKITWVCQRVLRPGDTMLDIGANYGLLTLYAAKLVGSTGCVHAFEPQPALIELIRKSVEISNFSQVSVHDFALSLNDEVGYMSVEPWNSGQAALVSTEVSTNAPKIQVKVRKTSDYLSSLSLKNIRLVKLDV
ncbi:MAG: FkbM family methyltransferase, partial [Chroococcidiopsidaceae cyanobacterium CP_BM_RX_35]|nr:FkbM family methyltransferase [Chroococcidiopsidaceae cyanobacterium CP_BM_RX_35]